VAVEKSELTSGNMHQVAYTVAISGGSRSLQWETGEMWGLGRGLCPLPEKFFKNFM